MNRRLFISRIAAVVAGSYTAYTFAQMGEHSMGGSMMGMDHSGMMSGNMGNMSMMQSGDLLATSALPQARPLPTLQTLRNLSSEAGVFEAELEAKPATISLTNNLKTDFWTYNGMIPGPQIEVYEGDRVRIRFKNSLPEPTTVHWHGLPVPASQDGNPQDEVPSGGERIYEFTLPDNCAGTYWFHPHGHNSVAQQVYKGLAGTFIVRSKRDPLAHLPEQHWLISDLRLDSEGAIPDNTMMDWMNGREGQFALINGAFRPEITLNKPTRIRVWNACSARYLNLHIPGCDVQLVGTDGGLVAKPTAVRALLLSPGERAELVVSPIESTETVVVALAYDRSKMGPARAEEDYLLAKLVLTGAAKAELPQQLNQIVDPGKATATKTLEYTEVMKKGCGMQFLINGKRHDLNRIDLTSRVGEVEEWTIFNNSHMDHNFHIHGNQFLEVDYQINGRKRTPTYKGWKDTINLRPYETARIKIVQKMKGLRMYHCHILEHETLGMMGQVDVVER